MNNTDRFTGKARAYAQGRPDYPASVVGLLTQESRRENPRLADIGSGTGILSRAMLERGWTVYGVEPNDDMRREAERRLSSLSAASDVYKRQLFSPFSFRSGNGGADRASRIFSRSGDGGAVIPLV